MEKVLAPVNAILLQSPDGKFQVKLYLGDDGSLYAQLSVRKADGRYEPAPSVSPAKLARAARSPSGEIIQFSTPV